VDAIAHSLLSIMLLVIVLTDVLSQHLGYAWIHWIMAPHWQTGHRRGVPSTMLGYHAISLVTFLVLECERQSQYERCWDPNASVHVPPWRNGHSARWRALFTWYLYFCSTCMSTLQRRKLHWEADSLLCLLELKLIHTGNTGWWLLDLSVVSWLGQGFNRLGIGVAESKPVFILVMPWVWPVMSSKGLSHLVHGRVHSEFY